MCGLRFNVERARLEYKVVAGDGRVTWRSTRVLSGRYGEAVKRFHSDASALWKRQGDAAELLAPRATVEACVTAFHLGGLCVFPEHWRLPARMCAALHTAVVGHYERLLHRIQGSTTLLHQMSAYGGFDLIRLRLPGRYDLPFLEERRRAGRGPSTSTDRAPLFPELPDLLVWAREAAPWLPAVRRILYPCGGGVGGEGKSEGAEGAERVVLAHCGCMITAPGAHEQAWHSDGPHRSETGHLPPHAVSVFVPLVTLTAEMGGTEMLPTSHLLHNFAAPGAPCLVPLVGAGRAFAFDYRLRHRGLANRTRDTLRPVLYLTYSRPGWRDTVNYSRSSYPGLRQYLH